MPGIAAELTEISGMKMRHAVPCDFISKEQVNEFLKKRVKETSSPEEVRAEELTLKKFGLIPQDFDLAKSEVDLLTEQAAAFYDYNSKKLSSPTPPLPKARARYWRTNSRTLWRTRITTWPALSDRGARATTDPLPGSPSWKAKRPG